MLLYYIRILSVFIVFYVLLENGMSSFLHRKFLQENQLFLGESVIFVTLNGQKMFHYTISLHPTESYCTVDVKL